MDEFARMKAEDRADVFQETARTRKINTPIIEKDFWVCWALKRVFLLEGMPAGLLFKGGTSLSKVFRAIDRFSEDVDLSFDRSGLGYGGESDPAAASSGKKARRQLEELQDVCRRAIKEDLLPKLTASFAESLGEEPGKNWSLQLDPDDETQECLLFRYPRVQEPTQLEEEEYLMAHVRLEIGARADHWPAQDAVVTPYAAEVFPHVFEGLTLSGVVPHMQNRRFLPKRSLCM